MCLWSLYLAVLINVELCSVMVGQLATSPDVLRFASDCFVNNHNVSCIRI